MEYDVLGSHSTYYFNFSNNDPFIFILSHQLDIKPQILIMLQTTTSV
jgi:hypothetical protein